MSFYAFVRKIVFVRLVVCSGAGEVPEWPKGTDCKSVGDAFGGSNPPLPTTVLQRGAGIAQLARASAFQAEGRGFESRFPLQFFWVNQEQVPT